MRSCSNCDYLYPDTENFCKRCEKPLRKLRYASRKKKMKKKVTAKKVSKSGDEANDELCDVNMNQENPQKAAPDIKTNKIDDLFADIGEEKVQVKPGKDSEKEIKEHVDVTEETEASKEGEHQKELQDIDDLFSIPEINVKPKENTSHGTPEQIERLIRKKKEEVQKEEPNEGPSESIKDLYDDPEIVPRPIRNDLKWRIEQVNQPVYKRVKEGVPNTSGYNNGPKTISEILEVPEERGIQDWPTNEIGTKEVEQDAGRPKTASPLSSDIIGNPNEEMKELFFKMKKEGEQGKQVVRDPSQETLPPSDKKMTSEEYNPVEVQESDVNDAKRSVDTIINDSHQEEVKVTKEQMEEVAKGIVQFWKEGWVVDSLIGALEEDPEYAWDLYQRYKINVERIQFFQMRLEKLHGLGFIKDVNSIRDLMVDLELTDDIETFIEALESSISKDDGSSEGIDGSPLQNTLSSYEVDQEMAYGKDAYLRGAYSEAATAFRNVLRYRPSDGETMNLLKKSLIQNRFKLPTPEGFQVSIDKSNGDLINFYQSQEALSDPKGDDPNTQPMAKTPEEIEAIGYNNYINRDYENAAHLFSLALQAKPNLERAALRLKICQWRIDGAS